MGFLTVTLISVGVTFLLSTTPTQAQTTTTTNREGVDQAQRNPPPQIIHEFTPEPSFWKRLFDNMHGSYTVTLMGPRFIGNSNETYNIYVPDVSPIQLYHSTSLFFQVSPDMTVGFGVDAVQNIANNVVGQTGITRGQDFTLYDPTINFTFPNLVKVPGWKVFSSASFSLSLTEYSNSIGRVTSVNINQNWRVDNYPSDWNYGFDVNLNPQFFTEPFPVTLTYRKTFYASIGHYISYAVSPSVRIYNSTTFDMEHRYPNGTGGFFDFYGGLDDRLKFGMSISPNIYPTFLTVGGYIQALFWNPQLDTTIIGFDFSIGF
ncbi:MAG: hypothetical protein JST80_12245 [Bdellovibrionales bacterium]|nr:hypothetical protein [Bdellovibrionales bacterium]